MQSNSLVSLPVCVRDAHICISSQSDVTCGPAAGWLAVVETFN